MFRFPFELYSWNLLQCFQLMGHINRQLTNSLWYMRYIFHLICYTIHNFELWRYKFFYYQGNSLFDIKDSRLCRINMLLPYKKDLALLVHIFQPKVYRKFYIKYIFLACLVLHNSDWVILIPQELDIPCQLVRIRLNIECIVPFNLPLNNFLLMVYIPCLSPHKNRRDTQYRFRCCL